jgi:hypothetical protein
MKAVVTRSSDPLVDKLTQGYGELVEVDARCAEELRALAGRYGDYPLIVSFSGGAETLELEIYDDFRE